MVHGDEGSLMGEGASCGQTGRVECWRAGLWGAGAGVGEPGLICKAREVVEGFYAGKLNSRLEGACSCGRHRRLLLEALWEFKTTVIQE